MKQICTILFICAIAFPGFTQEDEKLQVVVFLGVDCPVSQKYIATLNGLAKAYAKEVRFQAYVPQDISTKAIKRFVKEYQIDFDVQLDADKKHAASWQATITPEAFLFRMGSKHPIYHGAIDNWFYALGKYRTEATAHYLKQAIELTLQNKPVETSHVQAIGCYIEGNVSHHSH